MKKAIKRFTFLLSSISALLLYTVYYYSSALPDMFYFRRTEKEISLVSSPWITVEPCSAAMAAYGNSQNKQIKMKMMLLHLIPVKTVKTETVNTPLLVPSGMPFGIKMLMDGVMVVKTESIPETEGDISPAELSGIIPGDIIKSVNGSEVYSNNDIDRLTSLSGGKEVSLSIIRNGTEKQIRIHPVYSSEEHRYKLGIWVRDSSAGIGTVTYYDKASGRFGGLGHPVCDSDTGQIVPLSSGEVMDVSISGVKKGIPGCPGELTGYFTSHDPCGTLRVNNRYGVFGYICDNFACNQEIPIAMKHEIKKGAAEIYTTVNGSTPEKYSIEITKLNFSTDDSSRNMIIKITDRRLLEKSGGIVQGMSGSPVIQNGKLAGAVTHVFVNDPTSGYAIFCENMYEMSTS